MTTCTPGRPTGYEPLNTLKPCTDHIWLIDGPALHGNCMPFPSRATVVQLDNGDLWVHAPTQLTDGLRKELDALGPVRHLIAPNWRHFAYIADWQASYPKATAWAAPGVTERAAIKGMPIAFDHTLGSCAEPAWDGQIDQLIVQGNKRHCEAVFFHRESKSLIITDLIQNLETVKLPIWMRPLVWIAGIDDSDGKMPPDMRLTFRKNSLAASIEQLIAWAPERIILAHGRWFERSAVSELERAFRRILSDRRWDDALKQIQSKQGK
ncbi:DUF4336 domain-containing protein [Roseovarius aestuarii]|nr:DUF4336 domain-containing protein [Roseovarius aestuarii]